MPGSDADADTDSDALQPPSFASLRLLSDAVEQGARCLDGSPAAYYIRYDEGCEKKGKERVHICSHTHMQVDESTYSTHEWLTPRRAPSPDHIHKWVVFLEGGGWCSSLDECLERSRTQLGSSKKFKEQILFDTKKNLIRPTREVRADRSVNERAFFLFSLFLSTCPFSRHIYPFLCPGKPTRLRLEPRLCSLLRRWQLWRSQHDGHRAQGRGESRQWAIADDRRWCHHCTVSPWLLHLCVSCSCCS